LGLFLCLLVWVLQNAGKMAFYEPKSHQLSPYSLHTQASARRNVLMDHTHPHITMDLQGAADFLKMSTEEVRSRAARGLIPAAKPGKQWVFIEEDLASYLRSLYAYGRQATPSRQQEATICSGNVVTLGGLILHHRTESALDVALAQGTKRKPRNSTTASKRKPGAK
jgi:hypothetical protein